MDSSKVVWPVPNRLGRLSFDEPCCLLSQPLSNNRRKLAINACQCAAKKDNKTTDVACWLLDGIASDSNFTQSVRQAAAKALERLQLKQTVVVPPLPINLDKLQTQAPIIQAARARLILDAKIHS